jgi:hypothetical protein
MSLGTATLQMMSLGTVTLQRLYMNQKTLVAIIITLFSVVIYAQGTPGLSFTSINDVTAYEVSRGTATATNIEIPPYYEGLPVTRIANFGFQNLTTLISIIIPNSITTIGNSAFAGCNGLTEIFIPNSVETIGYGSFWSCSDLTSVTFESPSSLTVLPCLITQPLRPSAMGRSLAAPA